VLLTLFSQNILDGRCVPGVNILDGGSTRSGNIFSFPVSRSYIAGHSYIFLSARY
jgi:hypothetical protein